MSPVQRIHNRERRQIVRAPPHMPVRVAAKGALAIMLWCRFRHADSTRQQTMRRVHVQSFLRLR